MRTTTHNKPNLTPEKLRELAREACVSEKSVLRRLAGIHVTKDAGRRVTEVLVKHGLISRDEGVSA